MANQDAERAQMSTFAVAKQYAKDNGNSAPDLYASQFHNPTLDDYFALKEWETNHNPDIKAALLKNLIIAQHVSLLQSVTKQNYMAAQEAARKERMNPNWFRYLKYFEDNLASMSSLSYSEANQLATKENLHTHWAILSHNATKDSQDLLRGWISMEDSAFDSKLDGIEIGHLYNTNPTMDIVKAKEFLCSSEGIHRRSSGANICQPALPITTSDTTATTASTAIASTSPIPVGKFDAGLYVDQDSASSFLAMLNDNLSYDCDGRSFPANETRTPSERAGTKFASYKISYRSRGSYAGAKLNQATINHPLLKHCNVSTGEFFEHFAIGSKKNNRFRVFFQSKSQPPSPSEMDFYKLLNFTKLQQGFKKNKMQIYFKFCGFAHHPPKPPKDTTVKDNKYSSCTINATSSMLSASSSP